MLVNLAWIIGLVVVFYLPMLAHLESVNQGGFYAPQFFRTQPSFFLVWTQCKQGQKNKGVWLFGEGFKLQCSHPDGTMDLPTRCPVNTRSPTNEINHYRTYTELISLLGPLCLWDTFLHYSRHYSCL